MNKPNLFCDFDGVIIDQIKGYCDAYNYSYCNKENFEEADYTLVNKYDLSDQCPLADTQDKVKDLFACYEFWSWAEFMPNAYEVLERLNEKFNLTICSIGTNLNIYRKSKWIDVNLPFIKNCIYINNGNNFMDKSIIDMNGGILIDDVGSNLISSNAHYKICFGQIYDWNRQIPEGCVRASDWNAVEEILNNLIA